MRASLIVLVWLVLGVSRVAAAQDQMPVNETPAPPETIVEGPPELLNGWRWQFEPYAFVPLSTSGDVTVQGMSVSFDADIGDVVDKLQFAAAGRLEAWNKSLGFIIDTTYLQTGVSSTAPNGVGFSVSNRSFVGEAMVGYRIATIRGENVYPAVAFNVMGGGRAVRQAVHLTTDNIAMMEATRWKPRGVIGAEIPFRITDRISLMARGEVAVPDPYYTVLGGFVYDMSPQWLLTVAYRADWIRQDGDPHVDVNSQGPYVGLGFRFGVGPLY